MMIILNEKPLIRAFNMDCMDFMKQSSKTDYLLIADPPYGINADRMNMGSNPNRKGRDKNGKIQYGGESTATKIRKGRLNSGGGKLKTRKLNTSDIDWDDQIPTPEYFELIKKVSTDQIIWGGNYFPLGPCRCFVIWNKAQPWENFSQAEFAWTSFDYPSKLYTFSNRGGANLDPKIHETEKPVQLYKFCIKKLAQRGQVILDTHGGSGTIMRACLELGFDIDWIELKKDKFNEAVEEFKRLAPKIKQPKLFSKEQLTSNQIQLL